MTRPSENEIIARHFAPRSGPGAFGLRDDAAIATPAAGHDLVVSKDLLIAGVHFFADDPPDAIAAKALRVNLSDLAAKAAKPTGFLLGLALATDWTEQWLTAFADALADEATQFACPLLGGDTVAMPGPPTLSITIFGEVPTGRMVPRTGARTGDCVYVTGTIGDAALGLQVRRNEQNDAAWIAALSKEAADRLLARHRKPEPRLALREALRAHASAAMDVSDGLIGDLGKMLGLEGLTTTVSIAHVPLSPAAREAIAVEPRLLQTALTGGDDYEILCAVPPDRAAAFEAAAQKVSTPVSVVGTAETGTGAIALRDAAGADPNYSRTSFQHFT